MASKTLRTAIIFDPNASFIRSYDEEVDQAIEDFEDLLWPAKLEVYKPEYMYPALIKDGTELVLFDFGGMSGYGNTMMGDNSRRLIEYAKDHESTLCMVTSGFTWRNAIKYELEDLQLTELPNLGCRWFEPKDYGNNEPEGWDPIPTWFRQLYTLPRVDWADRPKNKVLKAKTPQVSVLKTPRKQAK